MKLCECGCGLPAPIATRTCHRWGKVKGQPQRFVRGHGNRGPGGFLRYDIVDRGFATPCWIWRARTEYGDIMVNGLSMRAHRFFYERAHGAVPEGLELDHLCRQTLCVNPDHLEPVTKRENILRGESHAAINARKTHCIRGHEFTPENTRPRSDGGRRCRLCQIEHTTTWKARHAA